MKKIHTESRRGRRGRKWFPDGEPRAWRFEAVRAAAARAMLAAFLVR